MLQAIPVQHPVVFSIAMLWRVAQAAVAGAPVSALPLGLAHPGGAVA
jgi:hypothetical protein